MYNDHSFLFKPLKESPLRVLLVETNVSVAVAVALWASFSSQGIAKASFVSALASFVVPFSHDARIAPSFIKDICCMMASK